MHTHTHRQAHTACGLFEQSSQCPLPFIVCVEKEVEKHLYLLIIIEKDKIGDVLFCVSRHERTKSNKKLKTKGEVVTCVN